MEGNEFIERHSQMASRGAGADFFNVAPSASTSLCGLIPHPVQYEQHRLDSMIYFKNKIRQSGGS